MSRFGCPNCSNRLPMLVRWRMAGLLRWRRVVSCPMCSASIRWSAAIYVTRLAIIALGASALAVIVSPSQVNALVGYDDVVFWFATFGGLVLLGELLQRPTWARDDRD